MEFNRWKNLSEIVPVDVESFVNVYNSRDEVLEDIEKFAVEEKVPILLPSAAALLELLIKLVKPEKILEIGTGIGYSTIVMAKAFPDAEILTVDSNLKRLKVAKEFFKKAGLKNVTVIHSDAFELIEDLLAEGEKFDFIFVDSVKSEYPFFNFKIQALLSERGMAVFDNVLFRGYVCGKSYDEKRYSRTVNLLKLFLNQIKEYPDFSVTLLPLGDGFLILKRKSPERG
ncbi:O-methyltransferase [Desulfurobacterium pacificum]|nr:O-methyltransferase [Desulfurobacterium pacificum]